MEQERKQCQNCKSDFVIAPEDFQFYEKIKVPAPTFCLQCRQARRFSWRNERMLYKRKCGLCDKSLISIYSEDKPFTVYCNDCYHGDKWDPITYGQEYDPSRPFFEQFRELQLKVPRIYSFVFNNMDSEYTNGAAFDKNCYLIFVSDHNEDSLYSYGVFNCKAVSDCYSANDCELCYDSVNLKKCYRVYYSQDCANSQSLYFCKGCANCQDCIGSVNLKNKKYYIFNEPYTKEDYQNKAEELGINSRTGIQELKMKSHDAWSKFVNKYIHGIQNVGVTGDHVNNSKSSKNVYDSDLLEDCKYINHGHKTQNCYDGYVVVDNSQNSYEVVSAITVNNVKCSYGVWHDSDMAYCDSCENSNNLFGCVGIKKGSYCILNKEYSKEEYEKLVSQIIESMEKIPYMDDKGRTYAYGEFFPVEYSPFAYNETVAQEYFPLTEEKAKSLGYSWKLPEEKAYKISLFQKDIPDTIEAVKDDITDAVIECVHAGNCTDGCTTAFRVTNQELQFYKKMNLPIPQLCQNCRHHERLKMRNGLSLFRRACECGGNNAKGGSYTNTAKHTHGEGSCDNEFETTYSPEQKDIVYCEQCYQEEVA